MYDRAVLLIKKGLAYVDHSTADEIATQRGTVGKPGTNSPYRNRSVEEDLKLVDAMKNGKYKEGECVLRAKIDMTSPNMTMRDPVISRITYTPHHNTKDKGVIE